MPDLNEFLNKNTEKLDDKSYDLERINGVRACIKCDEDVSGAFWDPIELTMSWKCSKGHDTIFKVG